MFMNIKKLIGETTEYDKKVMLEEKDPRSWCKSVSAFANGVGGSLIFGIANDDTVVGLQDAEGDAEKISRIIRNRMDPIPVTNINFEEIEGKRIIILRVEPGNLTPYYYVGQGGRTAYHRVGNESVPCDAGKIRELSLKGSGKTFDCLPSQYDFANMAFTKLRSVYYQRAHKEFQNSDYESFGLVDGNGTLTNAGALLADNGPVYQSRLFCTRWNGLTKASGLQDALDDGEFRGSLVTLLEEGVAFVIRNSHKGWFKAPDRRVELPDYPERSVTEGIVNALIHRDYLVIGSEVHIDMYDDRLEIYSPGGMFDGIDVQDRDIMEVPSRRRNPVIADVFTRLNYMERRGSGFKKIIEDYQNQYKYTEAMAPIFRSESGSFYLKLKNLNYTALDKGERTGKETGKKTGKENRERILQSKEIMGTILSLLKDNPQMTIVMVAEATGLSNKQAERCMEKLKKEGHLIREGSTKAGSWIVIDE